MPTTSEERSSGALDLVVKGGLAPFVAREPRLISALEREITSRILDDESRSLG